MDEKSINQEESQADQKKASYRKRKPLPPFLQSINKPQLWRKSFEKWGGRSKSFSKPNRKDSDSLKRRQAEVSPVVEPSLSSRHPYHSSVSSFSQQKGYYFTMAKASFWTIVAVLFFLGFLCFASGIFVTIYFFKEGVKPSTDATGWVGEEERKIGEGLMQTVEEEIWEHAGNTAFTRAVMPNDNSGPLSLSGNEPQTAASPTPKNTVHESPVQPATMDPESRGPLGHSHDASTSDDGSGSSIMSPPHPTPKAQPAVASHSEAVPSKFMHASKESRPPISSPRHPGTIQDLIQNPKARGMSYHASPITAAPTRDVHGAPLARENDLKKQSYTMNFGVFSTKQKALDRMQKLHRNYPHVQVKEKTSGKSTSYLVVNGTYPTEKAATEALNKISKEDKLLFSPKIQPEVRGAH